MAGHLSDFPELVAQYEEGQEFSPDQLTRSSNRKVRWVCNLGHTWETTVAQRTRAKTGCPFCSNQRAWPGFNDLETKFPEIAAEWHPTKNGNITPRDVPFGSQKKYWWQCGKGHEWDTKVGNRTGRGSGCRVCSGNEVQKNYNDLASERPDIAAEWHPELNGSLTPSDVTAGSPKKRWWICPSYGHSYEMRVSVRTGKQKGSCPYCSNQELLTGFNDLATVDPELARQWDYERNGGLTPNEIFRSSRVEVWWKCPNNAHPGWKQSPRNRSYNCGICLNQTLMAGFNDLSSADPELAKEWHPTLNRDKTPDSTLTGGRQKVWWLCEEGHHWEAGIYTRKVGRGCPYCSFKRLWPGFNDLATIDPDLAAEWHPTRNGDLSPRDVMSSVAKVVWWMCPQGHEYQASPNGRSRFGPKGRRGCNICANKVILADVNHLSVTHPELWKELVKDDLSEEQLASIFSGSKQKLTWRCSQGHTWQSLPYPRAMNGNGCPDCAQYGFKVEQPSVVYFLEHKAFRARKVGITNTHNRYDRVKAFEQQGWVTVRQWPMLGRWARVVESQAFAWIRGELDLPQFLTADEMGRTGGATETFSAEGPSNAEVIEKLEGIILNFVPHD